MGKYYMDSRSFNGHIMAEFKFNVLSIFLQHFKIHNSVILSFRHNEIVIQTMHEDPNADTNIKGSYTTTIPSNSLEKYEHDCNVSEVNVIITSSLMKDTSGAVGGCKHINVVSSGFILVNEVMEPLVEVSFDLYDKGNRGGVRQSNTGMQVTSNSSTSEIFGRILSSPYLHYLITSRIDYKIHPMVDSNGYNSIVVRNTKLFKSQYGLENRIFVAENGTILFCGCHHDSETDVIVQPTRWSYSSDSDVDRFDYELPNKIFKHLFRFFGQISNKGKNVIINNFEILIRNDVKHDHRHDDPESFKVGNLTFNKLIPSSVKQRLEDERKANRCRLLARAYDVRDDWSNVKPHCHTLNEHDYLMVLPEFRINHKYYSTHVIFKDFEPLRKAEHLGEHLQLDDDNDVKPSKTKVAYDHITTMIEECRLNSSSITQDDILRKLKELDPELYKLYLEGEVTPVFKV